MNLYFKKLSPDETNILYLNGIFRTTNDSFMKSWMLYLPFGFVLWFDYKKRKLNFENIGYMWKEKVISFKIKIYTKI